MAFIRFENVTVKYPIFDVQGQSLRNQLIRISTGGLVQAGSGGTSITALNDISFEIRKGDAVGLIGHNGSGKSTLLRTIAGIFQPDSGVIHKEGRVATVFDIGAGLEPELTGYENILILGMLLGYSNKEIRELSRDIAKFTELGEFLDLPVRTYSSGMKMRLMFSVATSLEPDILLVDELISTGDSAFQAKSEKRFFQLIESSKIFILASHDMNLIKKYCTRIFHLDHGQLTEV